MSIWCDLLKANVSRVAGTRVIRAGTGFPLLLLHGAGGHAENFRHNIGPYAERYDVIAPDLRWHGLSDEDGEPGDLLSELVEHVIGLLDALEVGACFVEGQSMGGWIATRLALNRPDRVKALVLTTPMGLMDTVFSDPRDLAEILASQLAALEQPTEQAIRRRMSQLFADPTLLDDEIVSVRRRIYADARTNHSLRQVARRYFDPAHVARHRIGPDELGNLHMPCLVYWGTSNDFSPAVGRAIAALLHADFHCARAGHWAQYEQFDEHNAVVLDFIGRMVLRNGD